LFQEVSRSVSCWTYVAGTKCHPCLRAGPPVLVVGASGFEPPTSWSRTTRIKSKLSNWLEFPVLPSHELRYDLRYGAALLGAETEAALGASV